MIEYHEPGIDLYCADCIEKMKEIPDKSVDLVVTSPPYNCGIKYNGYFDKKPLDEYYTILRGAFKEMYRLLKDDGRMCINHYFSMGSSECRFAPLMDINSMCQQMGFRHHGVAFWTDGTVSNKTAWGSWLSASAPYLSSPYEGILVLYKNVWNKQRKGISTCEKEHFMKISKGLWNFSPSKYNNHPATFPILLPKYCLNFFSYKDDVVLDPFMGSGTTGVACKELGRRFIGIEISEKYFEIAKHRIIQTTRNLL